MATPCGVIERVRNRTSRNRSAQRLTALPNYSSAEPRQNSARDVLLNALRRHRKHNHPAAQPQLCQSCHPVRNAAHRRSLIARCVHRGDDTLQHLRIIQVHGEPVRVHDVARVDLTTVAVELAQRPGRRRPLRLRCLFRLRTGLAWTNHGSSISGRSLGLPAPARSARCRRRLLPGASCTCRWPGRTAALGSRCGTEYPDPERSIPTRKVVLAPFLSFERVLDQCRTRLRHYQGHQQYPLSWASMAARQIAAALTMFSRKSWLSRLLRKTF